MSEQSGSKGKVHIDGRRLGYARISTTDQTLDLQFDALHEAGCERIYKDEGVSGAQEKRKGLKRLMQDLRPGDTLVVWKLDRLGRSLSHLIKTLRTLNDQGVGFCSIRDAIDTTTAGGRLYFHIMGALAEFERDLISERTKAGMAAAKARGVHVGRPRKLSDGDVTRLRAMIDAGVNYQVVAEKFNINSRSVLRYWNEN